MADETKNETQQTQLVEASAIESMERAMVDTQVSTAKRFPRPPLSKIRDNMLDFVTLDEETAASCFYTLPRGGKAIQGESIRMAEIAVSQYQNVRLQTRIVAMVTTGDSPYVVVQGVAFDLEKNVASSIEKRRRIIKKKFKDAIDEDDINLAVNACSAIAYRDATFKIIPKALIRPVFEAAKKVAIGDIRSLVAKRTEVIDRLNKMGAPTDRILAVIDARTIDDINVEKLQQLIGLGTALKDGETTLEDAFPIIKPPEKLGVNGLKDKIEAAKPDAAPPETKPQAEKGKKTTKEPPAETPKTEKDLRPKYICEDCNRLVVELVKDGKGRTVCPFDNCKAVGFVREATAKDYEQQGYK